MRKTARLSIMTTSIAIGGCVVVALILAAFVLCQITLQKVREMAMSEAIREKWPGVVMEKDTALLTSFLHCVGAIPECERVIAIAVDNSGDVPIDKLDQTRPTGEWQYLVWGRVTDEDMRMIAPVRSLRRLGLCNCEITEFGMSQFPYLPELEHLCLSGTRVGDTGMKNLHQFLSLRKLVPSLRKLEVRDTGMTDSGLSRIGGEFPKLEFLDVSYNNALTIDGIRNLLDKLPRLKNLSIDGLNLAASDIDDLRREYSRITILPDSLIASDNMDFQVSVRLDGNN